MSKKQRSAKGTTEEKIKRNISIYPEIERKGELLAQEDRRNFSTQVEWLIENEFERRQRKAA